MNYIKITLIIGILLARKRTEYEKNSRLMKEKRQKEERRPIGSCRVKKVQNKKENSVMRSGRMRKEEKNVSILQTFFE